MMTANVKRRLVSQKIGRMIRLSDILINNVSEVKKRMILMMIIRLINEKPCLISKNPSLKNILHFIVIYNVLQFYVDHFEILVIADFLFRIDHENYPEKGSNSNEGIVLSKFI